MKIICVKIHAKNEFCIIFIQYYKKIRLLHCCVKKGDTGPDTQSSQKTLTNYIGLNITRIFEDY